MYRALLAFAVVALAFPISSCGGPDYPELRESRVPPVEQLAKAHAELPAEAFAPLDR